MPTTGAVVGNKIGVYVGGTLIACATSATFEGQNTMIDATCKDNNGAEQVIPGQQSWSMSVDALVKYDAAYGIDDLDAVWLNQQEVTIRMGTGVTGDPYYEGTAYIESFSKNAGLNEVANYSVSFKGTGNVTKGTEA